MFGFATIPGFVGENLRFVELMGEFRHRVFAGLGLQVLAGVLFSHAFFSASY